MDSGSLTWCIHTCIVSNNFVECICNCMTHDRYSDFFFNSRDNVVEIDDNMHHIRKKGRTSHITKGLEVSHEP